MAFARYRNWPILWKIMIIPLISLLLIVAGTELVIMPKIEGWLMEQEKMKVRNVVEVAYQHIVQGAQDVEAGRMTIADAQRDVIRKIKQLRYSGTEYFWINDLAPRMVMHPTKPELDGTDLSDNKDPKGKYLFREFVRVCNANGEGFVDYMWPKPGESQPAPKISYVKLYKPWGWIIGSGLYVDNFKKKVATLHLFALGSAVFFSLALLVLAWSVARGVKRSLDEGCSFAAAVAAGDLTGTLAITRADEVGTLGTSLNNMVASLRLMIGRITDTAHELTATSAEIAHASRNMVLSSEKQTNDVTETTAASEEIHHLIDTVAHGVTGLNTAAADSSSSAMQLAASIEEVALNMQKLATSVDGIGESITLMTESIRQIDAGVQSLTDTSTNTASSILEFDSSIRQIEAYAKDSAAISDTVRNDANTGKKAVDETITGINGIMAASRTAAEAIGALSEKAVNIGSIVTVIEEIAQQTNLLALNASIIAAQTGEHGKGFGVVAAEIKNLAERTGHSTREIAEMVKGVQSETSRAVSAIDAAEESIRNGEKLSHRAGDALGKIVNGVDQTAQQLAEIARATKEQARGSNMLRSTMEEIATMTGAIAATTHQQRKGSEQIHAEVGKVRQFSSQVMRSMQEQTKVGDLISRMAQHVSELGSEIQKACVDQTHGSIRIRNAVTSIQHSASAVKQETVVVDNGVARLGGTTRSLQNEMNQFKV